MVFHNPNKSRKLKRVLAYLFNFILMPFVVMTLALALFFSLENKGKTNLSA